MKWDPTRYQEKPSFAGCPLRSTPRPPPPAPPPPIHPRNSSRNARTKPNKIKIEFSASKSRKFNPSTVYRFKAPVARAAPGVRVRVGDGVLGEGALVDCARPGALSEHPGRWGGVGHSHPLEYGAIYSDYGYSRAVYGWARALYRQQQVRLLLRLWEL